MRSNVRRNAVALVIAAAAALVALGATGWAAAASDPVRAFTEAQRGKPTLLVAFHPL